MINIKEYYETCWELHELYCFGKYTDSFSDHTFIVFTPKFLDFCESYVQYSTKKKGKQRRERGALKPEDNAQKSAIYNTNWYQWLVQAIFTP